jgi:hypothetical protein
MNRRKFILDSFKLITGASLGVIINTGVATTVFNEYAKQLLDYQDANHVEQCFDDYEDNGITPDLSSLEKKIESMKGSKNFSRMNNHVDGKEWARIIDSAYQKVIGESIEGKDNYQNLILTIMYQEAGFRSERRISPNVFITEDKVPECVPYFNNDSLGPMQVHLFDDFEGSPDSIEDLLVYSMQRLDKVVQIYGGEVTEENLPYIFGDWVSGDYASKVAAVQKMLNDELKVGIDLDGDLGPMSKSAIKQLNEQYKLALDREEIEAIDVGKKGEFFESEIYQILEDNFGYISEPIIVEANMNGAEGSLKAIRGVPGDSKEYIERAITTFNNIGGLEK